MLFFYENKSKLSPKNILYELQNIQINIKMNAIVNLFCDLYDINTNKFIYNIDQQFIEYIGDIELFNITNKKNKEINYGNVFYKRN